MEGKDLAEVEGETFELVAGDASSGSTEHGGVDTAGVSDVSSSISLLVLDGYTFPFPLSSLKAGEDVPLAEADLLLPPLPTGTVVALPTVAAAAPPLNPA